jgi:hypothetical protein
MNRRDVLKALGAVPLAGALGSCANASTPPPQAPEKETKAHTLQVLLEGAFAVVLQKQAHRLTAFVPLPDPARKDLAHQFCFNDPRSPREMREKEKAFHFELSGEGLHQYGSPEPAPYINPGYSDFNAETANWRLPPSLVMLDLPFPRSINFTGRPLRVRFGKHALKPAGLMPTNYILEYRVDEESKVRLKCDRSDVNCGFSPHCPPGVLRYYFAVGPTMKDRASRQKHAVDFFNFMLSRAFPDLAQKYEIVEIEPSDYDEPGETGGYRPASLEIAPFQENSRLAPAVLRGGSPRARLLPVASLVDCQSGGLLVSSGNGPRG